MTAPERTQATAEGNPEEMAAAVETLDEQARHLQQKRDELMRQLEETNRALASTETQAAISQAEESGDWMTAMGLKVQMHSELHESRADPEVLTLAAQAEEAGDLVQAGTLKLQSIGPKPSTEAVEAERAEIHARVAQLEAEGNWLAAAEEKAKLLRLAGF